ncbi:MAG: noncanonical pyrimidine nucleotidase, YjjG family [Bdellovibrionales bacterium RBG_16_40_8]|nr:MAG: noncanonical pyrimidine nucleotidase, YjjG family [Bdellovibrionales bacterium RBG_16_40_8]
MHYKMAIFDLDDTLMDFKGSQAVALKSVLRSRASPSNFTTHLDSFRRINNDLWSRFERQEITKEQVVVTRFSEFFSHHKIAACAETANAEFMSHVSEQTILTENAINVCAKLSKHVPLGIITNGVAKVQRTRLEKAGLLPHFSFVCVSEDCGFAKPQAEIFHYALQKHPHLEKILMIGDRLDADIQGAHNAGLASCWFNPTNAENNTDTKPHHEIKDLAEVLPLFF